MTRDEFLNSMKSYGARIAPAVTSTDITLTGAGLQRMRAAMIPAYMSEFYGATGGIILGSAVIYGPLEQENGLQFPIPTIVKINEEIMDIPSMRGMTVWGRNDLFWFAFDAFGVCYMLDSLDLRRLRKYDDPYRAMTDCMAVGKI